MDINIIELTDQGKDFSPVAPEDVVILPAFGASYSEMKLLNERRVQIVDTTCPWVRPAPAPLRAQAVGGLRSRACRRGGRGLGQHSSSYRAGGCILPAGGRPLSWPAGVQGEGSLRRPAPAAL